MVRYDVVSEPRGARLGRDSVRDQTAHWVRFGDQTLIWSASEEWAGLAERASDVDPSPGSEVRGQLYLVTQVGRSFQNSFPDAHIVLEKGRYLVVDLLPDQLDLLDDHGEVCFAVRPLPVDSIIVDLPAISARTVVPWVQSLVSAVSQATFSSYLTSLAAFPTRHSLSSHFTTAATWARDQLRSIGYQAELRPITVGAGSSLNVVADRQGRASGVRDLVLVTAHLDSINIAGGPSANAPGADDNASGSAGLMEIARVLAAHPGRQDLRLILFGGEEEGLHGSIQYVNVLPPAERTRIRAVINMDMVATLNSATPTVLLEGAAVSQALMTELAAAAAAYTSLAVQTSLHPFASDHVPFINALMPAVLTIEGADSANANIHTANDTLAHINYGLALDILRMNVATTATLLGLDEPSARVIASSAPTPAVAWGPNRLDVFVLGTDHALYHKWWNGSSWGPSLTGYEFQGGVITSSPETVAWGPNRLDVFVLGTDHALYHKWWNGSSWGPSLTGYEFMGGVITSQPEAVAWGPNRLDVFVLGTDRALYHKWWNGSSWGPSLTGYEFQGGVITSPPEAVAWGPNRLDVFVLGTDRALYHKWWNGSSWGPSLTGYEYMGGVITSPPEAVAWGPNRLDVFVLGTDRALYHKWWNGSTWGPSLTGYEYMGGVLTSPPTVVSWGPNRLDVFALGTDRALYHKWWNGTSWGPSVTGWEYMGGVITSPPRVASWGPNRLDVFVLGTDRALYHKWWNGSSWGPSLTGYEYMGGVISDFRSAHKAD
jgi:Zn-dependent M28 family amino/carboxypeptidase